MLKALYNGKLTYPQKGIRGVCPLCENEVNAKCSILPNFTNHWAHLKKESCDTWSEGETPWHEIWKKTFGEGHFEKVREKGGKKHFADIFTESEIVIELQNSTIMPDVIIQREDFYGEKMLWVVNGHRFRLNFVMNFDPIESKLSGREEYLYGWKWARNCWNVSNRPIFLDFEGDYIYRIFPNRWDGVKSGKAFRYTKKKFINKYGGDYNFFHMNSGDIYPSYSYL